MALPSTVVTGKAIGRFLYKTRKGTPMQIRFEFMPVLPYLPVPTATPPTTLISTPTFAELDSDGDLCQVLDGDPGMAGPDKWVTLVSPETPSPVTGWTWKVTQTARGRAGHIPKKETYYIYVPGNEITNLVTAMKVPGSFPLSESQVVSLVAQAKDAAAASAAIAKGIQDAAAAGAFNGTPGTPGAPGKDGANVVPTALAIAAEIKDPTSPVAAALSGTIGDFEGNFSQPFTALLNPTTGEGFIMKPNGDKRQGVIGWQHAGESGYILHFETRPAAEGGKLGGAHIGIGLDYASPNGSKGVGGILISNKKRAVALTIIQGTGITHADAYGIDLQQTSIAPAFHAVQNPGSGPIFQIQAGSGMGASERILEILTANGTSGTIASKDGVINWRERVRLTGARGFLHVQSNAELLEAAGDHLFVKPQTVDFRTYSGSSGQWFPKRVNASGQTLSLEVGSDATYSGAYDGGPTSWLKAMEIRRGATAQTRIGFYGTTPADQPKGVAVTPEAIHAALTTLGLIGD